MHKLFYFLALSGAIHISVFHAKIMLIVTFSAIPQFDFSTHHLSNIQYIASKHKNNWFKQIFLLQLENNI